jgi:hypothetical protein
VAWETSNGQVGLVRLKYSVVFLRHHVYVSIAWLMAVLCGMWIASILLCFVLVGGQLCPLDFLSQVMPLQTRCAVCSDAQMLLQMHKPTPQCMCASSKLMMVMAVIGIAAPMIACYPLGLLA